MIDYLDEFLVEFETNILTKSCGPFAFCCAFHDICLRDYKYFAVTNYDSNFCFKFYWANKKNLNPNPDTKYLYVDDIRRILMNIMCDVVKDLQSSILEKLEEHNLNDKKYCQYQSKIKKCSEWLRQIENGMIFKEFIDCYKNGYFQ